MLGDRAWRRGDILAKGADRAIVWIAAGDRSIVLPIGSPHQSRRLVAIPALPDGVNLAARNGAGVLISSPREAGPDMRPTGLHISGDLLASIEGAFKRMAESHRWEGKWGAHRSAPRESRSAVI